MLDKIMLTALLTTELLRFKPTTASISVGRSPLVGCAGTVGGLQEVIHNKLIAHFEILNYHKIFTY